jgi:hypothetical protein
MMIAMEEVRALLGRREPAVSICMPTHVAGRDISEDPIRLRQAEEQLIALGHRQPDTGALLSAAAAPGGDTGFWRHQSRGSALLDGGTVHLLPRERMPRQSVTAAIMRYGIPGAPG